MDKSYIVIGWDITETVLSGPYTTESVARDHASEMVQEGVYTGAGYFPVELTIVENG